LALADSTQITTTVQSEFGPLGRYFGHKYFESVRFPAEAEQQLKDLEAQGGLVVHVMRTTAWINFAYLQWALTQRRLRPIRAVVNLRRWLTKPFTRTAQSGPYEERLNSAVIQNGSALIFLRESAFNSARGQLTQEDPFPALVKLVRTTTLPVFAVPELLLWEKFQQKLTPSLMDRVFGSPESPGFLHSAVTFLRNHKRAHFRMGAPVDIRKFVESEQGSNDEVIARKIRGTLNQHLARETRAVFGPPVKPVDRLIDEAMRDRVFVSSLESHAQDTKRPLESVQKEAHKNFNQIAARYSPTALGTAAYVLHWIFNKIYDGIEIDEAGLERTMKAASAAPVVFTPSHKSHVDYLVMSYVLWQRGYAAPLVAAGANLSFFPLGWFLRRCGAFFLRRSFKGDAVYTATFRAYLKKIVRDGLHHEFFPEGGRSRTGKLLQPKLGLFSWLVDAILEGARDDLLFVPVAIDYERVVEGQSYTHELKGGEKKAEDLKGLLSAPKVLTERYGRIHLRFDAPVSLKQLMIDRGVQTENTTDDQKRSLVRALGHRVMHGISQVSTVTPHALLAAALLGHHRRGASVRELTDRILLLRTLASDLGAPLSPQLIDAPSDPTTLGPISDAMRMFASAGQVKIIESKSEPVFQLVEDKRIELSFVRNTLLNLLSGRAIVSAAILAAKNDSSLANIQQHALFLSRLFKLEFIYPVGYTFEHLFNQALEHLAKRNLVSTQDDSVTIEAGPYARPQLEFLAALLADHVESYFHTLQCLKTLSGEVEKKLFIQRTLDEGQSHYLAGKIIFSESLSKPNIETALSLFTELKFVTETSKKLKRTDQPIDAFLNQFVHFVEKP
jgi:glycerol-3-phosphate O-acyltransferase